MFSAVKPGICAPVYARFLVIRSVFLCSFLVCVCGAAGHADEGTTGNSAQPTQRDSTPPDDEGFPWEVKLRSLAALRCSGVLLDSRWVLTAASCFEGNYLQPSHYNIELYSQHKDVSKASPPLSSSSSSSSSSTILHTTTTLSPSFHSSSVTPSPSPSSSTSSPPLSSTAHHHSDQSIYVEDFYLHGRYLEGEARHNLALVQLHNDVTSTSAFADVIGPGDDVNGDDCVTVGWGSNVTGEPVTPQIRKWRVTNNTLCSRHHNVTVYPDELCAQLKDFRTGVCIGDIGAPLLCRDQTTWSVRGIVTHTWRCHDDDQDPQPARFLNVQHYLPFVQKRGNFKDFRSFMGRPAEKRRFG